MRGDGGALSPPCVWRGCFNNEKDVFA